VKRWGWVTALVLAFLRVPAQTGVVVFNDKVLHTIQVTIPIEHWLDTLNHDYLQSSTYPDSIPEAYRPCEVWFDGVAVPNCGIRERGNSSNGFNQDRLKKPFKIAFDAFVEKRFDGLKKINLNNFTNDPSLVRESIVYGLYRKEGIAAPRTSYARLEVNGEYWGLYLIVENIDKTFLRDHFGNGNEDGNLYRTGRVAGATLEWRGDSASDYQPGLKLTTNEELDDWSGFLRFVHFLNHSSDQAFADSFATYFDVDRYLRILAIEKLVRNWDSYWGGGNNYALYEHPNGQMIWIPWDVNETFQDVKSLSGTPLLDGYLIPTKTFPNRPLTRRLFAVPAWKAQYLEGVCTLLQTRFQVDSIARDAAGWHNLITEAYRLDPHKLNSYEEFEHSLHDHNMETILLGKSGFALRIRYPGIFPFVLDQREWASEQLGKWDWPCAESPQTRYDLGLYPNPAHGTVNLMPAEAGFAYGEIRIVDTQGRMVWLQPWSLLTEPTSIDISSLNPGLYVVQLLNANGGMGVGKLLVD
jgi:hypothetical protein